MWIIELLQKLFQWARGKQARPARDDDDEEIDEDEDDEDDEERTH